MRVGVIGGSDPAGSGLATSTELGHGGGPRHRAPVAGDGVGIKPSTEPVES